MALIIYGSPRSRTMRTLWAAEELGLDYELRPIGWDDPKLKEPEFLAINPAGTIPAIVDDGFALGESLAINLYLARKYGGLGEAALYPADSEGEASAWRWSLWAQGSLEPWVQRDVLWRQALAPIREAAAPLLGRALAILDGELRPQGLADRGPLHRGRPKCGGGAVAVAGVGAGPEPFSRRARLADALLRSPGRSRRADALRRLS